MPADRKRKDLRMQKTLALLIEEIVQKSPYNNILFSCTAAPTLKADGFWECHITMIDDIKACLPHGQFYALSSLPDMIEHIGDVFGENLLIQPKNEKGIIIVS